MDSQDSSRKGFPMEVSEVAALQEIPNAVSSLRRFRSDSENWTGFPSRKARPCPHFNIKNVNVKREQTHREEGVDEVGLDLAERLPLDDDGVDLIFVRRHQAAEPWALCQLGGTVGGLVVCLLGN